MEITLRVGYLDAAAIQPLLERSDRLSRMLRGLIRSLEQHAPAS